MTAFGFCSLPSLRVPPVSADFLNLALSSQVIYCNLLFKCAVPNRSMHLFGVSFRLDR
ncbi:MAG: hypothetical protein H6Q93_469, partial [Nitrospirae bacterium]|nr:hypothetical protein [Nitrospirota bacterium]